MKIEEWGEYNMNISYKKLWKLLIDRGINKTQLRERAHLSTNAIAKLGKNEAVSMETLSKICGVLHCEVGDIMEFGIDDSQGN